MPAWGWRTALLLVSLAGLAMAVVVLLCRSAYVVAPESRGGTGPQRPADDRPVLAFFSFALVACMLFFIAINSAGMGMAAEGEALLLAEVDPAAYAASAAQNTYLRDLRPA